MINFENYLHKIDTAFKEKEKREIYLIYIMIAGAIFTFAYLLFWDSSFDKFENTKESVASYQTKIAMDKAYLKANPNNKIVQLENEIKKINNDIISLKDTNAYIKSKIETISSLIYDERAWGEYLDSIATNAQKYKIKLLELTNSYSKTGSSFGHILDITVNSEGDYKNTLEFINSLEQSDLVVDIHDFNVSVQENLASDLNISVWGIRY
jgi:hypothetical protein